MINRIKIKSLTPSAYKFCHLRIRFLIGISGGVPTQKKPKKTNPDPILPRLG